METFMCSELFSDRELKLLNFCHLYLKTFHVSDLATSDGKQIRANCLSMSPQPIHSSWDWLQQASPNERLCHLWKQAIQQTMCRNGNYLITPLDE
eukprot:15365740-Ditylum_brightwellii.AAC.1